MLKKEIEVAINDQINKEFHSAFIYLSMSAYFEAEGLTGFAQWMKVQYQEELSHAQKFFDFVNERGGKVDLRPIAAVDTTFENILDVYTKTLAHEQFITASINSLVDLAIEHSDHATRSFLMWYVDEQVEEEANVEEILNNLKLIDGNGHGLLMMDREMKSRVFVDATQA